VIIRLNSREYPTSMKRFCLLLLLVVAPTMVAGAQQYPPATQTNVAAQQPNALTDVNILLSRIEQETQGMNADLGKLRSEKWKADSSTKQQAQQNVTSIQRNITAALPELINGVRTAPQSLAASFKLYRNLNALYEVLSGLAESTGAFGKRDEYDSLAAHVGALDDLRRSFADYLQQASTNADTRITAFQEAQAQAQAEAAKQPPKKIVVDDVEPATPVKKKKKAAKKSTANSSSGETSPSATSPK
jgi:hypothetical protein